MLELELLTSEFHQAILCPYCGALYKGVLLANNHPQDRHCVLFQLRFITFDNEC